MNSARLSLSPRVPRGTRDRLLVLVALGLLAASPLRGSEPPPVLFKEAISREWSFHVGGVQTPEYREVASREISFFVGGDPERPFREAVSREVSFVVTSPAVPERITQLTVKPSPDGSTTSLSWFGYNPWAQRDVARFDVYLSTSPFGSVASLSPFTSVHGETLSLILTNLPPWVDRYFAVVPVDAGNNADSTVEYAAARLLGNEAVSREWSLFVGAEPARPYRETVSREVSFVVSTPQPPTRITNLIATASDMGDSVTLTWTGYNEWAERDVAAYDVFLDGRPITLAPARKADFRVPGEVRSITLTNLAPWVDRFFAVVPVDAGNAFDSITEYVGVRPLGNEGVSREVSFFVGAEPSPPFREAVSREMSFVVSTPDTPAPVTFLRSGFTVKPTPNASGSFDLDWSAYNFLAQGDVLQFRIYVETRIFDDVRLLSSYRVVPGETTRTTIRGLNPFGIYYFAVVAEDVLGKLDPIVRSISEQAHGLVDNFADRESLDTPSGEWITDNLAATREASEPNHAGKRGKHSLWMTWKAPSTGVATFRTTRSNLDTLLAVYTGSSLGTLVPVASNDDDPEVPRLTSVVHFDAVAGTDYQIAVDGYEGFTGDIVLGWSLVAGAVPLPKIEEPPSSVLALSRSTVTFQVKASPPGVTYQWFHNSEPMVGQTNSRLVVSGVQAPDAGDYQVRVTAPGGGSEVLSEKASLEIMEQTEGSFGLSADKVHDLFNDSEVGLAGSRSLHRLALSGPPVSVGLPGSQYVDNTLSTPSSDDPPVFGLPTSASRWFRLRFDHLPAIRAIRLSTEGSEIPTLLAVFTNRLDLRLVAQDAAELPNKLNAAVWLKPERGVDYLVMVDGRDGRRGRIRFNLDNEETQRPPACAWVDGNLIMQVIVPDGEYQLDRGATLDAWEPVHRYRVDRGVFHYRESDPSRDPVRFFRLTRVQ